MQSEPYIIELTLVAMPLPKEKEDAYWDAIRVVAEMVRLRVEETPPQPIPKPKSMI